MKHNNKKIFCPMITSQDIGGGIKSTISLLNGLSKLDYTIMIMLPKNATYIQKFDNKIEIYYFDYDPIISIKKPIYFYKISKSIKYFIINNNLQDQIILCSDRPALMLLNQVAKKCSKIIYISRGWFYTNISARLLRCFLFPYVKIFVGISDKQVELMKKYNPKKEVKLIQNGIPLSDSVFKIFKNDAINIATIGGICERKNQLQCVKLIERLNNKNIFLNIYGQTFTPADEKYKKKIKNYIAEKKIKNINFKGHQVNIEEIYKNTDIVISTAVEEGFGRTIIEAMNYGIPVIANIFAGGPSTIIQNNLDGILYDSTLDDLQKNTEMIINNEKFRIQIIENGFKKVKKNYTDEIMCKNYANLIESLYEN